MFVDNNSLNRFSQNFIQKKQKLLLFSSALSKMNEQKEKDIDKIRQTILQAEENIALVKKDLEKIKNAAKLEEQSPLLQTALKTKDIFLFLDESRQCLQATEEQIRVANELFLFPKEASHFKDCVFDAKEKTGEETDPDQIFLKGKEFLQTALASPHDLTSFSRAHNYLEKAAELYMDREENEKAFACRQFIADNVIFSSQHPLYAMQKSLDERIAKTKSSPNQGAQFGGLGAGSLKRGIISVRKRRFPDGEKFVANFHVNRVAKKKALKTIDALTKHQTLFVKALPVHLKGEISIKRVDNGYFGKISENEDVYSRDVNQGVKLGEATEIRFGNYGSIRLDIGKSHLSMENRVIIEVDAKEEAPGIALKRMYQMATLVGLGPVFGLEPSEEAERKQIALLFHTFYPKEAYHCESQAWYYELSPQKMKEKIEETCPEMKEFFNKYLSENKTLEKTSLTPEVSIWSIPDLAQLMQKEGAVGIMSGFNGNAETVMRILRQGPLCSQERFEIGECFGGTSPGQDHIHGGGGSIFTRVISNKMTESLTRQYVEASGQYELKPASQVCRYPWSGQYQLLYDLSIVNVGGYAYNEDCYGSKSCHHYAHRLNLIDFVKSLNENSIKNELMIRERIAPQKIKKILTSSAFQKKSLIEELEEKGFLIEKEGKKYFKDVDFPPVDEFIIVGKYFTADMWQ